MSLVNILNQTKDNPAFPDLIWSKPENRTQAGHMALIGGNLNGFNSLSKAYTLLNKEVVGAVVIELPDALFKKLKGLLPEGHYLPSNPSGGFSKLALGQMLEISNSVDHTLFVGEMGANSETEIVLERFLEEFNGNITVNGDAINLLSNIYKKVFERGNINLVIEFSKLQKLGIKLGLEKAITSDISINSLAEILISITTKYNVSLVTYHLGKCIYAHIGKVGSTPITEDYEAIAVKSSVWIMQNPSKVFEALASATYELI